ncbi:MAG: hypothetical protein KDI07_14910 [Anaerolineae bacterium]|nr:hypothetical protein [Anaerolineae bacterium]MCB9129519.1 hypothetical protein [Anaerolineales bacterium]MCB0231145.1 hypothetical protein [Anaerolineae bacterium]MCB0240029.1 hypothetical protein [Anaerolineae bacterium]MCB0244741.1 hypothetical protein [Anaerolineae bacterium]
MDFLTIGNLTKDLVAGGHTVGGAVTYASVAALRQGWRPGILSRIGPDVALPAVFQEFEVIALPASHTLTFENTYTDEGREQIIHAVAESIEADDVPALLVEQNPAVVLLGPVANEVAREITGMFPNSLLGVVPQGWMRRWDDGGRVYHIPLDCGDDWLAQADVLVVSTEDVGNNLDLVRCFSEIVEVTVLTRGTHGCDLYYRGHVTHVPARRVREVDPTGAGDTFTAAFLIRYCETGDPLQAARYANVAASFCVEGISYSTIPSRPQVKAYLAQHGLEG